MNDNDTVTHFSALKQRQRLLIATALFEYILNEEGKPFELQSHSNVEEIRDILETDYRDLLGVLKKRKTYTHFNMRHNIAVIQE